MRIGKDSVGGEQSDDTLDISGLEPHEDLLQLLNRWRAHCLRFLPVIIWVGQRHRS